MEDLVVRRKTTRIFFFQFSQAVVQWRLGVARRIQALLRKFLSSFGPYLTFKLHRLFWRRRFGFKNSNNGLQTQSKPFHFLLHQVPYTRTRITFTNAVYHACHQHRRAQALFNLPLHHQAQVFRHQISSLILIFVLFLVSCHSLSICFRWRSFLTLLCWPHFAGLAPLTLTCLKNSEITKLLFKIVIL